MRICLSCSVTLAVLLFAIFSLAWGDSCNYTLDRTEATVVVAGGSFALDVTTQPGCSWSAVSNNPDWLTVTGGTSGSASGTVTLSATANAATAKRTGSVTIAGQNLQVTQKEHPPVGVNTGQLNVLVILANYADNQAQPFSPQTVQDLMTNNSTSLASYVNEASYGKATLHVDVTGWTTLPRSEATYLADNAPFFQDALDLVDASYDLGKYRSIFFIDLNDVFGAQGSVGAIMQMMFTTARAGMITPAVVFVTSTGIPSDVAQALLEHEFGHTLGLQHTGESDCQTPSAIAPNLLDMRNCILGSDMASTMSTSVGQYTAIDKSQAGWIDQTAIVDALPGRQYVLDQFELPSSGNKVVRVPIGTDVDGSQIFYWLHYHAGLGLFDSVVPDTSENGKLHLNTMVRQYLSSAGWFNEQQYGFFYYIPNTFLNVADAGQPYRDPYRGIEIQVVGKNGAGAGEQMIVQVNRSSLVFGTEGVLNFGSQEWNEASPVYRDLRLYNTGTGSIDIASAMVSGDASFAMSADACSGAVLQPQGSCSMTMVYQPNGVAQNVATLMVNTNDALRPTATVALYGAGTDSSYLCTLSVDRGSHSFNELGGQFSVNVTAPDGCPWQVTPNADWYTVSPGSGSGNGTVTIAANPNSGQRRWSSVTIGNLGVILSQEAPYFTCPVTLSPDNATFPGTVQIQVTTSDSSCTWNITNLPSWLTSSAPGGRGLSSTVTLTSTAGSNSGDTIANFTIGGATFTAKQPCSYAINQSSLSFSALGGIGSIALTTQAGCQWTVANAPAWLEMTSATGGAGNGVMTFSVPQNAGNARSATFSVAGTSVTVSQAGVTDTSCSNLPVMIRRNLPAYATTLQGAYAIAGDGDTIQGQALDYIEDLNLNRDIKVKIKGGFDCNYLSNSQVSTVDGLLRISRGSVRFDRLILR